MAANNTPIFPLTPGVQYGILGPTQNTDKFGLGTVVTVATGQTSGTRVDYLRVRATGTNTATVLRVFINNGSANSVTANNTLFTEATIASTTLSEVAALAETTIQLDLALPYLYKINCTIGTAISATLAVSAVLGDY